MKHTRACERICFVRRWDAGVLLALPDLNHFTILRELSEARGPLALAANDICAASIA